MSSRSNARTVDRVIDLLEEVAARLEASGAHACAGAHCAICSPAKNLEDVRTAQELVATVDA